MIWKPLLEEILERVAKEPQSDYRTRTAGPGAVIEQDRTWYPCG